MDYIFRWLGSRFLSDDDKANLGLIDRSSYGDAPSTGGLSVAASPIVAPAQPLSTVPEDAAASGAGRSTPTAPATPVDGTPATPAADEPKATAVATAPSGEGVKAAELTVIATNGNGNGHVANGNGKSTNGNGGGGITLALGNVKVAFATQGDAPSCMDCGAIMVRNGSCYKCLNCGSTSGCS